jgi:hypothetical protein
MAPVVDTVAPSRLTNPPDCAITPGESFPVVAMVVGPVLLGLTVVVAPVWVRMPNARGPEVEIEPPLIVVFPPFSVSAPIALAPLVAIVELVIVRAPPPTKSPGSTGTSTSPRRPATRRANRGQLK